MSAGRRAAQRFISSPNPGSYTRLFYFFCGPDDENVANRGKNAMETRANIFRESAWRAAGKCHARDLNYIRTYTHRNRRRRMSSKRTVSKPARLLDAADQASINRIEKEKRNLGPLLRAGPSDAPKRLKSFVGDDELKRAAMCVALSEGKGTYRIVIPLGAAYGKVPSALV